MALFKYAPDKEFFNLKDIPNLCINYFTLNKSQHSKHLQESQALLKKAFGGSLKFYSLDSIFEELNSIPELSLAYASCYISLDYYSNRILFPKSIFKVFSKNSEKKRRTQLEYYQQRFLDAFTINYTQLILLYLIRHASPDQKKVETLLKKPVLNELKKTPYLVNPVIEELSVNSIDFNSFLIKQNQASWEKLNDKLDQGKPWPVRLVSTDLEHPALYYPFIAYNYVIKEDCILLSLQDTLNAELLSWEFPITENKSYDQTNKYCNGILFDEYLSILPPLNFLNKIAYYTKIGSIFWWIGKFVSIFLNLNKTMTPN